ncbi:MAG: serine/threonine protein kinase [Betaproteobacteria bacterium]|nr:serine/threonine protein kinase [Betaproteobacteria bacterium]
MNTSPFPSQLGKYRIDGILGEGSMGVVYRGFDPELDRRVAIKTLHKDVLAGPNGAEMFERFKREANAGIRLSHKHVVTVYEFGEDSRQAFMAMELIDGQSLRELNAQRAPWPLLEALELAHQLLEALDFFHERGVVHRDIKPANIMVDAAGRLTVTDFGIARTDASELTQVGTILGTPSYMSPEQITGQPIDGRSDLFSVGVILYEMLTATKPFRGEVITIAHNIVCEPHPEPSSLNTTLPPAIDRLFRRALAKKPDERFRNGAAFREALREMLAMILPRADGTPPPADYTVRLPAAGDAARAKPAAAAAPLAATPEPAAAPLPADEPQPRVSSFSAAAPNAARCSMPQGPGTPFVPAAAWRFLRPQRACASPAPERLPRVQVPHGGWQPSSSPSSLRLSCCCAEVVAADVCAFHHHPR